MRLPSRRAGGYALGCLPARPQATVAAPEAQMYIIRPRAVENEDALKDAYNRLRTTSTGPRSSISVRSLCRCGQHGRRARARGRDRAGREAAIEAGEAFAALPLAGRGASVRPAAAWARSVRARSWLHSMALPSLYRWVRSRNPFRRAGRLPAGDSRELQPIGTFDEVKPCCPSKSSRSSTLARKTPAPSRRRSASVEVKLEDPEAL